ncbi:MAG: VCBS repeat-containing protein [Deltaproteobacteria bacterium]|nr:VCBS repeat-containing protein [Deltaproteobacteria bacterium]MBN2673999.1 VCBS repeat-containing protein [Deltaproteobacteria bacterium]
MRVSMRVHCVLPVFLALMVGCKGDESSYTRHPPEGGSSTGGTVTATCDVGVSTGDVAAPVFWKNIQGQTSWFASPVVFDLDGNGSNELIAAYYSIYVLDSAGELIAELSDGDGRVYAGHVVVDLEGDGNTEIVAGNGSRVFAYEWNNGAPTLKAGWPANVNGAGTGPEVRGMAAGDLNGDGSIEIVVTTTETAEEPDGGSQVWVFNPDGTLYQPDGLSWNAWPRYNAATGEGNDADRNGYGHHGYGCYGLNVGIGNIDDDSELEIIATYDNHHIQAFDHDGVAINASPWFTNRSNEYEGERFTWGQFIRWVDPQVEEDHYHNHTGEWPHPSWTEWAQWTHSPPNIVDLDLDGRNEVLGVPNIEMHEPYETQAFGIMVLEGAHGDGSRSAMRKAGFETLKRGDLPVAVDGWYPPQAPPAAATVNILGDERPEIIVSLNDWFMYAFDADGEQLWRYNYSHQKDIMFASEPIVADLNQDGSPEILFTTYGDPGVLDSGNLVILAADGTLLHDVSLPNTGENGNGNGAPAAPTVGDLDGDGELEIFIQTFEHGMDIYKVPGSTDNCLLWSTARGGPLRMGQPSTARRD